MTHRLLAGAALAAIVFTVGVPGARLGAAGAPDADKGRALYDKCAACHTLDGEEGDGPTLKGVVGRKAGMLDSYRYSAAMSRSEVVWNAETLDAFITDPQKSIPRNKMAFAGMTEKAERDDLVAYLLAVGK